MLGGWAVMGGGGRQAGAEAGGPGCSGTGVRAGGGRCGR